MTYLRVFFLFLSLFCLSAVAVAQTKPTSEELYGQGVHAFQSGNYQQAVTFFDQVESLGTPDPRVYFYRGLANSRLGQQASTVKDFQYASDLELSKAGQSYSVPTALRRVQGKERVTIEYYRRTARQKWNAEQAKLRQYEFEVQKAKDRQIYNGIITSGEAVKNVDAGAVPAQTSIPFGARPVDPFGKVETVDPAAQRNAVSSKVTEANVFKQDLDRPGVLPQKEVKKTPVAPKKADAFENFDFGGTDDASVLSPPGDSENSAFAPNIFESTPSPSENQNSNAADSAFDFSTDTTNSFPTDSADGFSFDDGSVVGVPQNQPNAMPGMGSSQGRNVVISPGALLDTATSGDVTKQGGKLFGKAISGFFKRGNAANTEPSVSEPAVTMPAVPVPAEPVTFDAPPVTFETPAPTATESAPAVPTTTESSANDATVDAGNSDTPPVSDEPVSSEEDPFAGF